MIAILDSVVVRVEKPIFYGKPSIIFAYEQLSLKPDFNPKVSEPLHARDLKVSVFVQPPVDELLHQGLEYDKGIFCRFVTDIPARQQAFDKKANVSEAILPKPKDVLVFLSF